jgi:hypothetical protein
MPLSLTPSSIDTYLCCSWTTRSTSTYFFTCISQVIKFCSLGFLNVQMNKMPLFKCWRFRKVVIENIYQSVVPVIHFCPLSHLSVDFCLCLGLFSNRSYVDNWILSCSCPLIVMNFFFHSALLAWWGSAFSWQWNVHMDMWWAVGWSILTMHSVCGVGLNFFIALTTKCLHHSVYIFWLKVNLQFYFAL